MGFNRVAMTVVVLAGAGVAMADITPVGEFMGDMTEGFENVLPPGGYAGPIDIFEGNVSMDDTLAHFVVISFIWSGPGGEVLPYNGNLFGGTVAGSTLFTFDTPVSDFGGYFTTVGAVPGGSVVFRDAPAARSARCRWRSPRPSGPGRAGTATRPSPASRSSAAACPSPACSTTTCSSTSSPPRAP